MIYILSRNIKMIKSRLNNTIEYENSDIIKK